MSLRSRACWLCSNVHIQAVSSTNAGIVNSIEVSPRLCRGDSQRLTYTGRCDFPVVPPKAQRKGSHDEGLPTITAHALGMQISYRLYSEVSEESVVYGLTERPWARVPGTRATEGVSSGGGAFAVGSCPYVSEYSPQVRGGGDCGVSEGEECDSYCPDVPGQGT